MGNEGYKDVAPTALNLKIEFRPISLNCENVKAAAAKKPRSEAELIHPATRNLWKAVKRKIQKPSGRLYYGRRNAGSQDRV